MINKNLLTKPQQNDVSFGVVQGDILVVDDTPASLRLLLNMLEEHRYRVRVSTKGSLVLTSVQISPPDLILLDINMPDMNGYQVCEQLKSEPLLKDIPIIFISASDEVFDKVKAFQLGAVDYITKPFQFEEVIVRIKTQIKLAYLQKELEEKAIQLEKKTIQLEKKTVQLEKKNNDLAKTNQELVRLYKKANLLFSAFSETLTDYELNGKYLLKDQIGKGGNGIVYKAIEIVTGDWVAIKIFRPNSSQVTTETIQRLNLEGLSAIRVNHSSVVAVLDFGVAEECLPYLVMELLNGHTLREEIDKTVCFELPRAIEILLLLCEVLHKMHSVGIVHRDIKPENVFLHQGSTGEVLKVLDFGIAKIIDTNSLLNLQKITLTGNVVGTPAYIAPERLLGLEYDGKSDVYSLGIMAYIMLTGRLPFEPLVDFQAMLDNQLYSTPRLLRDFNPNIPKILEDIILSAIDKRPHYRPTALELAKKLKELLENKIL